MQIVTPKGQAIYVHVFRPQPPMEGSSNKEPQYSVTLLFDEGSPRLEKLKKAIVEVAESKFGKNAGAMLKKGQLRSPIRPGSDKEDKKDAELYEGKEFMKCASSEKPQVVDKDLEDIIDTMDVYSGCFGRCDVWLFPYDKAGNRGVGAILNSFQKLDDGERLSGRRPASDAFGENEEEDELLN